MKTEVLPQAPSPKTGDKLERRKTVVSLPQSASWFDVPAWLTSLLFHMGVFLLFAWLWTPIRHGTGAEVDRAAGIAIVHQTQSGEEFAIVEGSNSGRGGAAAATKTNNRGPEPPPLDVDQVLGSLQGAGDKGSGLGANGLEGTGTSAGPVGAVPGGKKGGQLSDNFFYGIAGQGNSFVYVIDRSDSMNEFGGAPLRAAKRELMQSLDSLKSVNQFQIIFYNDNPTLFRSSVSGAAGLIRGHDVERRQANNFVRQVVATGGTEHVSAIRLGLRMQPDVLFFLTDAAEPRLTSNQLNMILESCDRAGTTIHAVEFGSGPDPGGNRWIEVMATKTGGQYRYVDTTSLIR